MSNGSMQQVIDLPHSILSWGLPTRGRNSEAVIYRKVMKCQDSFVAGGNTSCSSGELVESQSSHVKWALLPEGLVREETMTMFVYQRNRLRTLWATRVVCVEARCEQAFAVTTSDCHRDR
jgi:hypothetical protein